MGVAAVVEEIWAACRSMAGLPYDGEPVDQLEHALQAAALARAAGSDDELLVAALLHDIARAPAVAGVMRDEADHHHGELGSAWLTPRVGARVAWLAEQHVAAKRYLVAVDAGYRAGLSPTSVQTLADQGGPMSAAEVARAEAVPDWGAAVRLRRWDDLAKIPEADVPGLDAYRDAVAGLVARTTGVARAMAFDGPGRPLRPVEVPVGEPDAGEVVVRISATTVCGSDVATWSGARPGPEPCVLGHESVGVVEAPGAGAHALDGRPLRPGDRVVWTLAASCRACPACLAGMPQKCASLVKYGHEPLGRVRGPAGGLADRVLLPRGTSVVRVPDHLDDRVACPASCATATVAGGLRVARLLPAEVVVVTGLGALGLTACAMASAAGATVVGLDVDPARVALAPRFGATRSGLLADIDDVVGDEADVLLELSGAAEATQAGLGTLGLGGRAALMGAVRPGPPVALDAELVVRRMLRIEGLHNYVPADLQAAVAFLDLHGDRYPFAALVDSEHALEHAAEAFAASAAGAVRVLVRP